MRTLISDTFSGVTIKGNSRNTLIVKNDTSTILSVNPRTKITTLVALSFDSFNQNIASSDFSSINSNLLIEDVTDRSKKIKFDLSLLSTDVTRRLIMPDQDVLLGSGGGGGIIGPATTTINAIVRWNNTSGTVVKDSSNIGLSDDGEISFTETTSATKGIIFPDNLLDAFHFKDSTGDVYLQFNSTDKQIIIEQDVLFNGGITANVDTSSTNIILDESNFLVRGDTIGGNMTVTLPPVVNNAGRQYKIIKVEGANTLSIIPNGADLIDGLGAVINMVSLYERISLISDGISGWFTL